MPAQHYQVYTKNKDADYPICSLKPFATLFVLRRDMWFKCCRKFPTVFLNWKKWTMEEEPELLGPLGQNTKKVSFFFHKKEKNQKTKTTYFLRIAKSWSSNTIVSWKILLRTERSRFNKNTWEDIVSSRQIELLWVYLELCWKYKYRICFRWSPFCLSFEHIFLRERKIRHAFCSLHEKFVGRFLNGSVLFLGWGENEKQLNSYTLFKAPALLPEQSPGFSKDSS